MPDQVTALPEMLQSEFSEPTQPSSPSLSPQWPQTTQDLCTTLRLKNSKLLTFLSRSKKEQYTTLRLPKPPKAGKERFRIVHNPSPMMRFVQYRILTELLDKIPVAEYVFAFEKAKSIPQMAVAHVGKKVVISVDLKDFFPTIKQKQVEELLVSLGFGGTPARTLSELMTLGPNVPQGALTSPKISNILVSNSFGPVLKQYCDDNQLTLTIYADDVTISADREVDAGEIIRFVTRTVRDFKFLVNREKTKIMKSNRRQYVCGAVVNQKVNLMKKDRLRLRAIVHNCMSNGLAAEAAKNNLTPNEFLMSIRGKLNWFGQLNQQGASQLVSDFKTVCETWERSVEEVPFVLRSEATGQHPSTEG